MWKGRFQQATAALLQQYSESISFDWRLWRHDIEGSIAHSAALEAAGLITRRGARADRRWLARNRRGDRGGHVSVQDRARGHPHEHRGRADAAHRRRGRQAAHRAQPQRPDRARSAALSARGVRRVSTRCCATCSARSSNSRDAHREVIIPGYTHLQRAQPVYFAHHLLAYVEMFERDRGRIADARKRDRTCCRSAPAPSPARPSCSIANSSRACSSFPRVTQNSMDAVSDRDFAVELLAALALIAVHLSRLSEDVILWASSEFQFITISDAYTTGSLAHAAEKESRRRRADARQDRAASSAISSRCSPRSRACR